MQIKTRLTIQFILIVAGILLLSLLFIYLKFQDHTLSQFQQGLYSKAVLTAEMILKNVADEEAEFQQLTPPSIENALPYHENVSIYNEQNELIYSLHPPRQPVGSQELQKIRQTGRHRMEHHPFSALGIPYINQYGRSFVVVSEAVFNSQDLLKLRNILIIDFFVITGFVAIGGWFFSRQALLPVKRIMDQMSAILPTDLSTRLPTHNHDELSQLVETFNNLLNRIQQAFDANKSFISNVSHELKNPLTVISAQLEVILNKDRAPDEYRATLRSVLEDVRELNEVSDKLLQLAQISTDRTTPPLASLRLDEVIWQAKATLLKNHPHYKVHFEVLQLPPDEQQLFVTGNEALLRTALLNLMDNGCKFSPDRQVKVTLNYNQQLAVEVKDHGPGIEVAEQQQIFEPFYRGANGRTARGSGVGLSLVSRILRLHGVSVSLVSAPGQGASFQLLFPPA